MNILSQKIAAIEKHISTHSERSVEDIAAVTTLKDFFKYDGNMSSLNTMRKERFASFKSLSIDQKREIKVKENSTKSFLNRVGLTFRIH